MACLRRWGTPWLAGAVVAIVEACGSSETPGTADHPEGGALTDARPEARPPTPASGGAGGAQAGGAAGALGTGCTFVDAAVDPPSPGSGGSAAEPPDATTVQFDGSTSGTGDSGTGGSSGARDGGAPDAPPSRDAAVDARDGGGGPVTYPPLKLSAIGKPVAIRTDFLFTEGPVWDPAQQVLFFTDINADVIYRLTLPDTFEVAASHVGNPDGLALDPDGNLIAAGYVSRDIWRLDGTKVRTIADSYRGRKLNSPDELVARSDGVIYFTDPTFGIDGSQGFTAQTAELCFQGVYRIAADGSIHLEDQSTAGPNGVVFSPDEQLLYVSYTNTGEIYSFDVAKDGSLGKKTLFASGVLVADSTCVDAAGNLYVASLAGITILDPSGKQVGVIVTTGQVPTNCAFGGPDQRTFFITARTALVGAPTKGNSSLLRIDDMPIPGIAGRP